MKFRVSQWLDMSDKTVTEFPFKYGIQGNRGDGSGWRHVAENGKALIFDSSDEAAAKIDKLKAQPDSSFKTENKG